MRAISGSAADWRQFGPLSLSSYKLMSGMIVSEELLQDAAVDLGEYLPNEIGLRLPYLQIAAFVNGDGAGAPTGYLANVTAITAPTGNSTTFRWDDLVTLVHSVPIRYRTGAGSRGAFVDPTAPCRRSG